MRRLAATIVLAATGCTLLYSKDDYLDESMAPGIDGAAANVGDAGDAGTEIEVDAEVDADCHPYVVDVLEAVDENDTNAILTVSRAEADATGFPDHRGAAFRAALEGGAGSAPVYVLRNPANGDRLYTISTSERDNAHATLYTEDHGIAFWVPGNGGGCKVPVQSFQRLGHHRLTARADEAAELEDAGWKNESPHFYAGRAR